MHFRDLNLIPALLSALETEGYDIPTPVQSAAIPSILEGKDLLGCAQTGTGKTAAFALPILQRLSASAAPAQAFRPIRALILTPTRELASQIADSFSAYGRNLDLRHSVVFGGVGEGPQKAQLRRGVDILVATPGRLLDLLEQPALTLSQVEVFVLDEADRMLDMGFVHDVRRICALVPARKQTLLFSATMPHAIRSLADGLLRNPVRVEVTPVSSSAANIDQGVYFVPRESKSALLRTLLADPALSRALVFTRTKHGADRVRQALERNRIPAEAIHGNKSQGARQRSLANFKQGVSRVLVATDLAARGIDVDGISHVINFDLSEEPETYVHRIGRTARAGSSGVSLSFCSPDERGMLSDIERLQRKKLRVLEMPAFSAEVPMARDTTPAGQQSGGQHARGREPSQAQAQGGRESSPRRGQNPRGQRQGQGHGQGSSGGGKHRSRHGRDVKREYYSNGR